MNPIVLIHGALGCGKQLEPLAAELEKLTSRPVHIFNCPGHGGEPIPLDGFSMEVLATELVNWLRRNNILGADVFGYSMGGYIALLAVKNAPERIRHILTLGTKFEWSPESAEREISQIIPEKVREKVPKFANYLASLHGQNWDKVMEATQVLMTKLGQKPLLNDYSLSFIQHPVIVARGSRDVMVSREETESVALSLPDAHYEEIEGWPHPIQLLPTEDLAKYMLEKLGK